MNQGSKQSFQSYQKIESQLPIEQQQPVEPIPPSTANKKEQVNLQIETNPQKCLGQLITLIKLGNIEQVRKMLETINSSQICNKFQKETQKSPLYYATMSSQDEQKCVEMIHCLLQNGANPCLEDDNKQTVLFYACREGKRKCVDVMIKAGTNIQNEDVYEQTPLFYVASENRLNLVDLFNNKDNINHIDNITGQTALFYSARKGHLDMCKILIQKGANIQHLDNHHKSAAEYAKRAKYLEVAEYLNGELKKSRQNSKMNQNNNINESSMNEKKKKKDVNQNAKLTYKLVFMNQKCQLHDLTEQQVTKIVQDKPLLEKYLTNPENIPTEELQAAAIADTWQRAANKVLNLCWKLKGAYWFHEAVDPVRYNIMDYFDIVSKPMDLGNVKKKLQHNFYSNAKEFIEDMELIWNNCYRYNGETHDISKYAKQLETAFTEHVKTHGLRNFLPNEPNQ